MNVSNKLWKYHMCIAAYLFMCIKKISKKNCVGIFCVTGSINALKVKIAQWNQFITLFYIVKNNFSLCYAICKNCHA